MDELKILVENVERHLFLLHLFRNDEALEELISAVESLSDEVLSFRLEVKQ